MGRQGARRQYGLGSVFYDEARGHWVGQLPRDEFGRRAKVSAPSEAEAQRKLYAKLRERQQGLQSAARMTVRQFLEAWVRDTLAVSDRDARTIEKHERAVRLRLVPALGKLKLVKLTPMHVQQFVGAQLAAGIGPTAVQQALVTLRLALKQAVLWGMLARNVATVVEGVRIRSPEPEPFTADEQGAILDAARGDRLYLMVVLAYATGLRQSEVLGVRWSDLDLDAGWLRVRQQMGRDGRFKDLKTEAARRAVPLPGTVVALLRAHRGRQDRERADAIAWDDPDLVLCTATGRPINQRNAHRSWTRMLEQAGVRHRGMHHLRHTFVTALAERGVPERATQHLAGHADSRMTRRIYTHVTDAMLEAAADAIEDATGALPGDEVGSPIGTYAPDAGGDEPGAAP